MSQREVQLIEQLLAYQTRKYLTVENSKEQLLYERGYLIGLLASLAYNDSLIKDDIRQRLKKLQNEQQ